MEGPAPAPRRQQLAPGLCFEPQPHSCLLPLFTDREARKGSSVARVTQLRAEGPEPRSPVLGHSFSAHQAQQQLSTRGKLGGLVKGFGRSGEARWDAEGGAVLRISPQSELSTRKSHPCHLACAHHPYEGGTVISLYRQSPSPGAQGGVATASLGTCPLSICLLPSLLGRPLSSSPEVGLWSELPRPCLPGSGPAQALEGWSSGNPTTTPVSGHGPPPLSLSFLISQNKRTQEMPAAPASAEPLVNGGFSAPVCVTWNCR